MEVSWAISESPQRLRKARIHTERNQSIFQAQPLVYDFSSAFQKVLVLPKRACSPPFPFRAFLALYGQHEASSLVPSWPVPGLQSWCLTQAALGLSAGIATWLSSSGDSLPQYVEVSAYNRGFHMTRKCLSLKIHVTQNQANKQQAGGPGKQGLPRSARIGGILHLCDLWERLPLNDAPTAAAGQCGALCGVV